MATIKSMKREKFEEMMYLFDPPPGILPASNKLQSDRTVAFLSWIDSPTGPGLESLLQYLKTRVPRIFISYRRSDSNTFCRELYNELVNHYGQEAAIFRDVDSIPGGSRFQKEIEEQLSGCNTLLVVIGPTWLDVTNTDGKRRLDNPQDWVRLEIEYALDNYIQIIPVLIDGTQMPLEESLPGKLTNLFAFQAIWLWDRSDERWEAGIKRLIRDIDANMSKILEESDNSRFPSSTGGNE